MSHKAKKFFVAGFLLSLGIFSYFLLTATIASAVDVNVSAQVPEICGNGIKQSSEECDDGNTTDGDGCNSLCENEGGIPPICIPKPAFLVSCGVCVNGSKVCTWATLVLLGKLSLLVLFVGTALLARAKSVMTATLLPVMVVVLPAS